MTARQRRTVAFLVAGCAFVLLSIGVGGPVGAVLAVAGFVLVVVA